MAQKTVMWKYWGFSAMDNRAAQAWLNDMAAQGWALEGIHWDWFAKFVPATEEWTYFVDWSEGGLDEEESYLRLCRDAGWEQVAKQLFLNIYRAKPGTTPIQTDPAEEYERFKTRVAVPKARGWAIMGGVWAALGLLLLMLGLRLHAGLEPVGVAAARMLADHMWVTLLACAPAFLAVWIFHMARLFRLWRGWRESALTGAPLPTPSPGSIRVGRIVNMVRDICVLLALSGMMLHFICGPRRELWRLALYAAIIAAAGHGFASDPRERYRRTAKYRKAVGKAAAAVTALTIALHFTVGPWLVGQAPAIRPAELVVDGYQFRDEEAEVKRGYSALAAYADWGEFYRVTDDRAQEWKSAFSRARWACTGDWAADVVTGLLIRELEPVEGRTDIWRGRQGDFDCCVVRRGSTVERISRYSTGRYPMPEPWWSGLMDDLTGQLEQNP